MAQTRTITQAVSDALYNARHRQGIPSQKPFDQFTDAELDELAALVVTELSDSEWIGPNR